VEILGGRTPNIDFIGLRKPAFALSAAIVALGLVAFVATLLGRANLGIDFVGGVAAQVKFERPVPLDEAREALASAGFPHAELQSSEGGSTILVRVKRSEVPLNEAADRVVGGLRARFADNPLTVESSSTIGPSVSADLKKNALIAVAISLGAIVLYLAFRFHSWRFGATATFTTFHDVLAMLGVFWLLGKEINLLLVVALLTIAGYSLTDTVVIFDRIRELITRTGGKRPLGELINRSINEVLSRTIVTSLTVFFCCLSLLIWGGEVLRDFALALTVGVLVGSYSSVFVAAPILYVWGLPQVKATPAPAPAAPPRASRPTPRASSREVRSR
jgi:preprotein translocase SecF subunit